MAYALFIIPQRPTHSSIQEPVTNQRKHHIHIFNIQEPITNQRHHPTLHTHHIRTSDKPEKTSHHIIDVPVTLDTPPGFRYPYPLLRGSEHLVRALSHPATPSLVYSAAIATAAGGLRGQKMGVGKGGLALDMPVSPETQNNKPYSSSDTLDMYPCPAHTQSYFR